MSEKLYSPLPGDESGECGYRIVERDPGAWHWIWSEPDEEDQISDPYGSQSEAYGRAADDWEECGNGADRLSATLRGQATRLRGLGR